MKTNNCTTKKRTEKILEKISKDIIEKITNKAVQYFEHRNDKLKCNCGKGKAEFSCQFGLTGSKSGELCGKLLCEHCAHKIDEKMYCRVHAKMLKK